MCWTPPLFGALLRIPGVVWTREQRERLIATIAPDALRPVAEFFGFRKPARTVEFLHRAAQQRAGRGSRRLRRVRTTVESTAKKGRAA
jgi:hypothetical protein